MKALGLFTLLFCSAAVQADVKLLVEFDGDKHKIVRADKFNASLFMQPSISAANKVSQNKALLSYQKGTEIFNIELHDPRIRRVPMSKDGMGHEEVLLKKGVYTVTLRGTDIDLKSLRLQLPNKKAQTPIEYAAVK